MQTPKIQHLVQDIDRHFNHRADIEYVEVSREEWEAIKAAIATHDKKAAPQYKTGFAR